VSRFAGGRRQQRSAGSAEVWDCSVAHKDAISKLVQTKPKKNQKPYERTHDVVENNRRRFWKATDVAENS
jgi:hypothetical protein